MTDVPALLAEVERLDQEATAGPWRSTWTDEREGDGDDDVIVSDADPVDLAGEDRPVVSLLDFNGDHAACSEPNAALIAAFRTAAPTLAAEVRRLTEENARLKADLKQEAALRDRQQHAMMLRCPYCLERGYTNKGGSPCPLHMGGEARAIGKDEAGLYAYCPECTQRTGDDGARWLAEAALDVEKRENAKLRGERGEIVEFIRYRMALAKHTGAVPHGEGSIGMAATALALGYIAACRSPSRIAQGRLYREVDRDLDNPRVP